MGDADAGEGISGQGEVGNMGESGLDSLDQLDVSDVILGHRSRPMGHRVIDGISLDTQERGQFPADQRNQPVVVHFGHFRVSVAAGKYSN